MKCPLCTLAPLTARYYADDVVVVCDCLTCGVPMIVFRDHVAFPTAEMHEHAESVAAMLGMRIVRMTPRKITYHAHYHCAWLPGRGPKDAP